MRGVSRQSSTRLWRAVIVAALSVIPLSVGTPAHAQTPIAATPAADAPSGPGDRDPALYASLLDDQREAVYAATAGRLSRYRVAATFTPSTASSLGTITGALDLRYVNATTEPQPSLPFRLYPNSAEYADGGMTIDSATSAGGALDVALSVAETVATVRLAEPVQPGAAVDLRLAFTSTIPTDPAKSYGMFAKNSASGSYALANWLPLLAGFDPVKGWLLDPPSMIGDPVFTNVALFDVALVAPGDFNVITTGSDVAFTPDGDGATRHHIVSGPTRDFVMVIGDNLRSSSWQVGGTTVTSHFRPMSADGGAKVLTFAAQALAVYSRLFGTYPYKTMDVVEVDLGNGAGGVEFPELTFIGADYYGAGTVGSSVDYLEFIVAHEIGHQWWYGMVGDDQYRHAFMDEALVNYSTTVYFGEQHGADAATAQINRNLKLPYLGYLFDRGDLTVDTPTESFPSQQAYGALVYGKGALGFGAVRAAIGDRAYFAALRAYLVEFRFEVASPPDLLAAFETASGQDVGGLWRHWFEAPDGRQDYSPADLVQLLKDLSR